jgi:hypothetical protein
MIIQRCLTRNNNHIESLKTAIQTTILDTHQKNNLNSRFTSVLQEYSRRSTRYSHFFNTLRITITVGSLIVPAILSIQYTSTEPGKPMSPLGTHVYWAVWILSLLVTISNGIITLLKVDKKYYVLNTTYQHLLSEGWQYVQLSGKYSGFYTPATIPTHKNQFVFFCNMIEKIRMKQVEDEYYKVTENHGATVNGQQDQLIPPTPAKQLPFSSSYTEKSTPILNGGETTVRKHETPTQKQGLYPFTIEEQGRDNE